MAISAHVKMRDASFGIRDPQLVSVLREIERGDEKVVQSEQFDGDARSERGAANGAIVGTRIDLVGGLADLGKRGWAENVHCVHL